MIKGFVRNFKPLEILTEEQEYAIHRGTLDVLEETGVQFYHDRALKVFEKNGCKVDYHSKRVKFPSSLVEECIRLCPSSFRVKARDSSNDIRLSSDNTLYFESSIGMETFDMITKTPRKPTRKEAYDFIKVLDWLPNMHFQTCYPYYGFDKVPPIMCIPEICATKARNSSKVQMEASSRDADIWAVQIAQATGQELLGLVNAAPPLTYYQDQVDALFRYVEAGFPFHVSSGPLAGGSAPATHAGAIITNNAEILAGITLVQLLKPHARVWAGNFLNMMNMRGGSPAFGDIGNSLCQVMFDQLYRHYEIPRWCSCAAFPASKEMDFQLGYEKAIGAMVAALGGASSILFHGAIYGELTAHPIQAILDDDIAGMIGRLLEGVTVNDETLALDLINSIGPIPGFYLDEEHSRKWWKSQQYIPLVADRLTYPEWITAGRKSCIDYAEEKMNKILTTHKMQVPLTASEEENIEKILKEATEYYKEKGMISDEELKIYNKSKKSRNFPYE